MGMALGAPTLIQSVYAFELSKRSVFLTFCMSSMDFTLFVSVLFPDTGKVRESLLKLHESHDDVLYKVCRKVVRHGCLRGNGLLVLTRSRIDE